jgi:hypothetical protein
MASFEARLLTDADHDEWLTLWQGSRQWLAQHPGYHRAMADGSGGVIGVWSGQRLVLALPFHELHRRGLRRWVTPLWASFGGPLVAREVGELTPDKAERFWREALGAAALCVPSSINAAEAIFAPGCVDVRGLSWHGWEARPHYNYVSEWSEPGGWRASLEGSVRRQERKALDAGLSVRVQPANATKELESLWRRNAARTRLDADLAAQAGRLGAWLASQGAGFVVEIVAADGAVHAAALVGHDAHRVYYHVGASEPDALGSGAPTLLQTAILDEIDRRGLSRCYDWVGANTPGVARFKRHFGPRLELLLAVRLQDRAVRLLETARGVLRRRRQD